MAFLADPGAYDHRPGRVEVIETHMSWVFLADQRVYKLKKPLRYDFVDFSTLEDRRRAVQDELRLNRRLSSDVYLGVHSLHATRSGELTLKGDGEIVDWLVVMRRLPDDRSLESIIVAKTLTHAKLGQVSELLIDFYRSLPAEEIFPDDHVDRFKTEFLRTASVLSDPALQLEDSRVEDVLAACNADFEAAKPVLLESASIGQIVEGHGDLRPQHVFLTEHPVIIDCLEFNRSLRLVDPFDEIAGLGMECALLGAERVFPDLAEALMDGLERRPCPTLLSFYWRYRALLRARLSLLHLVNQPNRTPEKWRPLARRCIGLAADAELRTRTRATR